MRRHRIGALAGRRFRPCTTDSHLYLAVAPNLLAQRFTAPSPNRVWLADITYIAIGAAAADHNEQITPDTQAEARRLAALERLEAVAAARRERDATAHAYQRERER